MERTFGPDRAMLARRESAASARVTFGRAQHRAVWRWRRWFHLIVVLALLAGPLAFGGGATAAPIQTANPLRAVTVDPALVDQLAANPRGVAAVVTAWNSDALDEIERLGVSGARLRVLPMILTDALTPAHLQALRGSPAVRSVWANTRYELYMEDSTWITRARYVWGSPGTGPNGLQGFGITGKGVELAVIDTGFDGMHEDGDNLIEYCETLQAVTSSRHSVLCTPWDPDFNPAPAGPCGAATADDLPDPLPPFWPVGGCPFPNTHPARGDSNDPDVSHGTHVGGTMAGTGHASGGMTFAHSTIGMSPHAKLRVYSANIGGSLFGHQILSSYDDMTYKKIEGYNDVVAVNNSWGGGDGLNYDPEDPINVAVKLAWQAGILSVFAAGNSGPEHDTLSRQCVNPYVACVAASTKPDHVVMFSSRGRPSQPQDTNRNGVIGQPGAQEDEPNYDPGDVPPDNHDWRLGQALELGRYRPTLTAPGVNINSMKAIGANIGDPTSAACREDPGMGTEDAPKAGCYIQANGTSMATPHVSGAIGLIVQAFRQGHGDRTPTPNELIDILELSSNRTKLPAYEAEEQGAGRLDAYEAVRIALTYQASSKRPNLGYPTPPYVTNQYPHTPVLAGEDPTRFYEEVGCTGTASWTGREIPMPVTPAPEQPPLVAPQRYGQHFIDVPPNTDRLRVTATWNVGENMYLRLWRPGVNPDAESQTPDAGPDQAGRPSAYHQSRVFPDQEAVGLVFTGTSRWLEVRSPEESNVGPRGQIRQDQQGRRVPAEGQGDATEPPSIPAGKWILRVYHRFGETSRDPTCALAGQETPKQAEGHRYDLRIEMPEVTFRPSVKIDEIGDPNRRFVEIEGRAGYPPHRRAQPPGTPAPDEPPLGHVGYSWEGITNWEVPGSAQPVGGTPMPEPDTRPVLYFHGNPVPPLASPDEINCDPEGRATVITSGTICPFLHPSEELSASPYAARWTIAEGDQIIDGTSDRNIYDPNWVWCLATGPYCPPTRTQMPGPTTVGGPMTVEWWAMCAACAGPLGFDADWVIRLWADGVLRFEQRVTATPANPLVPSRLVETVSLPQITANQRFTLHIDPVYIDSQAVAAIYYDSQNACDATGGGNPCASLVRMPVGGEATTGQGAGPENVRVTDLPADPPLLHPYPQNRPKSPALRIAWDPVPEADRYEVYRSTNPLFPNGGQRIYSGPGTACTSPQAPTPDQPPGHDRQGRCVDDKNVQLLVTYYYRVVAVDTDPNPEVRSASSEIAYGTPTRYDRQVKLKVDRIYGPQYWEYALLPPSPTPLDTTNPGTQWRFLWDTRELLGTEYQLGPLTIDPATGQLVTAPGPVLSDIPHLVFARSFTQGIGSTKDGRAVTLDDDPEPPEPPQPGCPDDDDGDGDDDDEDGDGDDDGDDSDDDCEDDDDHEEDDDD